MSEDRKKIVSVQELSVGIRAEEGERGFRFRIDYGSFDVFPGDFVLIKGRNGCGKSTLLRFFRLQSARYFGVLGGGILFYGQGFPEKSIHLCTAEELTKLSCMVSYIGQDDEFLTADSAYSYIYHVCKLALENGGAFSRAERKRKLAEVDAAIRAYYEKYLAEGFRCKSYRTFKYKRARAWSGGQQKMICVLAGIIKAKVCGLRLIVLDEPLNNLDGKNKYILNELLGELRRAGTAILAVTHCQVFDGVNKVLYISEGEGGDQRAALYERADPAHSECLEPFRTAGERE